tara:strand:- start:352 stop:534 length:183 start_codon:yes stop_codon:yes gene_type:complete
MKVGNLVRSIHDQELRGIVTEVGPPETAIEHGRRCARIHWDDGNATIEFIKLLEVISEAG